MARVEYDSRAVQGSLLAEAVSALIRGQGQIERVYTAADVASNAGTNAAALEGGAFGCAEGQGGEMWTMIASVRGLLQTANTNGLETFLSSLDNGDP
jgi:hypothetical protein